VENIWHNVNVTQNNVFIFEGQEDESNKNPFPYNKEALLRRDFPMKLQTWIVATVPLTRTS